MKKRLIGTLLMGALFVSSTSVFVSCKDYDDDINSVSGRTQALEAAKVALEGEISSLKSELETAKGQITSLTTELGTLKTQYATLNDEKADKATYEAKVYNLIDEIKRAVAAEAALEARLNTAESSITSINALIGGKLDDGKTYKEAVTDLYAQLEAVKTGLGNQIVTISGDLTNYQVATNAVLEDYKQQLAALQTFKTNYGALLDGVLADFADLKSDFATEKSKSATDKAALEASIAELAAELEQRTSQLQAQVGTIEGGNLATMVQALQTDAQTMQTRVEQITNTLNVLNVLTSNELRGLVFIPESYYWGIEAATIHTINYAWYHNGGTTTNIPAASPETKEVKGYVGEDALGINYTVAGKQSDHARYPSTPASLVLNFVANYHLNPSNADSAAVKKIEILDGDKRYVTRASEAQLFCSEDIKDHGWENGILSVNINVRDLKKIKSVKDDEMVTTFATRVTLGNDTVITSDYAAAYKDTVKDMRLVHTNLPKWSTAYAAAKGYVANAIGTGGYIMNKHCGDCTLDNTPVANPIRRSHLMATVAEAAEFAPQDSVNYNDTIDLSKIVETHFTTTAGKHEIMDAANMKLNNLYYKYELTQYIVGNNKTSESAQAAIKDSLLRPQMPGEDGKGQAWGAIQSRSTIGRTPIVRVSLMKKDADGVERTIDYGYIRIKITEKAATPIDPSKPLTIAYQGPRYSYTYGNECVPAEVRGYEVKTTWILTQYDIYHTFMNAYANTAVTREEFEAIYSLVGPANDLDQFDPKTGEQLAAKIGKIETVNDDAVTEDGTRTSTLKWTLTPAQAEALFVENAKTMNAKAKTLASDSVVAVKYTSNGKVGFPDFYIVFKHKGKTADVKVNKSSAKVVWDDKKITNWWYGTDMATGGTGKDEIHAQVLPVEQANAGEFGDAIAIQPSDLFIGNNLKDASYLDITDGSSTKAFSHTSTADSLVMKLIFDAKNTGKEYVGADGKTYVTSVSADGSKLIATEKGTLNSAVIAVLAFNDINDQQVVYQKNDISKALLNAKAHNNLAGQVAAYVGLDIKNKCGKELPLDTYNPIAVRFLRPINVIPQNDATFVDGTDHPEDVNMRDLVYLTDWRDFRFMTNYWHYYNIKNITIDGIPTVAIVPGTPMNIAQYVETNLSQANENTWVKLSDVSKKINIIYNPVANKNPGEYGTAASYGTLSYENIGAALGTEFKIRFKVRVTYEWGYLVSEDYVTITVKPTVANSSRQK